TGDDGKYSLELPAGIYNVSVESKCNQPFFDQKDVRISVGETTKLPIALNALYSVLDQVVSPYQLISNPEKYQDRTVVIEGFLHVKDEDSAIYVTKDDADYLNTTNALWVSYAEQLRLERIGSKGRQAKADLKSFDGKYVLIKGVFDTKFCGHM